MSSLQSRPVWLPLHPLASRRAGLINSGGRMVAPELEKLASQRSGSAVVAKVDTDAQPELSVRFGIRSIPTLVVFRNGREAKRIAGAMSASAIAAQLGL